MAAIWSGSCDNSGEGDKSSSDEEFAINYMAFGATFVEDEIDGKDVLTSDPIEEIDEEVAIEVVGVATHWDMAHTLSRDKFGDLDEEDDSIDKMENIGDDSIVENLSSHSINGNVENMDLEDYLKRDRKSTRLNSSHRIASRMPSSA